MKIIILAAGIGSRLGRPYPKPLTVLSNGKSILQNQIEALLHYVSIHDIMVVVGFKKELIMEAFPELTYVYNSYFDTTNTSKSLLKGVRKIVAQDMIWLNGDVVFDHQVIKRVLESSFSCMAVNTASVAEEEVKYKVDSYGMIEEVSKDVQSALGEAVGINKLLAKEQSIFEEMLESCEDQDYFEKAIELAIPFGLQMLPIDISDLLCTEVDFEEDLQQVNRSLSANS